MRVQKIPSTDGTAGFWNTYAIRVIGDTVTVRLNGVLVSEGTLPPALVQPGCIGLQYHDGKVQFRAVRVRRL